MSGASSVRRALSAKLQRFRANARSDVPVAGRRWHRRCLRLETNLEAANAVLLASHDTRRIAVSGKARATLVHRDLPELPARRRQEAPAFVVHLLLAMLARGKASFVRHES